MKIKISIIFFMLFNLITAVESNNDTFSLKLIHFNVDGMSCGSCVNRCGKSIDGIEGIISYQIDLQRGMITVHYDPVKVNPLQIKTALETTPFKISDIIQTPKKAAEPTSFFEKFINLFQSK